MEAMDSVTMLMAQNSRLLRLVAELLQKNELMRQRLTLVEGQSRGSHQRTELSSQGWA
jgi:hypothetical protein